jgi:two-component system alkaline phosphatase synthesis response regulator PhoP
MTRILIIEDNVDLAFGLRNNLEIEGYAVDVEHDGSSGLRRARSGAYDLIVLDLTLPELHGLRILRTLREEQNEVAVLILTAHSEETDKVRGLKLGADDYVAKPFGLLEFLARVEALLRRGRPKKPRVLRFGDVEVDLAARKVSRAGAPVELTPKEYELLLALARQEGTVVSRLDLMRDIWGYSDAVISRTIDTHVAELRRKLEPDPTNPRHIVTARKFGYRFQQ